MSNNHESKLFLILGFLVPLLLRETKHKKRHKAKVKQKEKKVLASPPWR